MKWRDLFTSAYYALSQHKLRSSLTLLGIVIGVGAVVAMMSMTAGLDLYVNKKFSVLGANTFKIRKFPMIRFGGAHHMAKYQNRRDLTLSNAQAVRVEDEAARYVGAELFSFAGAVRSRYAETSANVFVIGGMMEYALTNSVEISEGRNLSAFDVQHERDVAVLGADVASNLFPFSSPIGRDVIFGNRRFQVVGVFVARGSLFGMRSMDNFVLVPISTFVGIYGKNRSVDISVQAMSGERYDLAFERALQIMRRERGLKPGQEDDFEMYSNESIIDTVSSLTDSITWAAIGIAFVSLLVGGIGIMNIMMVSVTERTREIGVRMAIGARKNDILRQFTAEAILLSVAGGALGLLLGFGAAYLVDAIVGVPAAAPLWAVLAALATSSSSGLIFGIYPAWKASRLDPIDCLRYE